jgi:hypothetical protein
MYATRHAYKDCWTSSELSCLAEPVTPSLVTTEQAQAMTTKNTIFGKAPLIRGCLLFNALAGPQQLQVKSKVQKRILDGFSQQGCLDSEVDANLAQTLADVTVKNQYLILKIDSPC